MALSGPIKTPAPWGGPGTRFGGTWENLNRWDALLRNAANEFGAANDIPDLAPGRLAPVLKAMMVIESQGTMYRADGSVVVRLDDGYGGGPTVGMMQVKPQIWQWLVPAADAYTPEGNIRLGAAIMAHAIRQHGSWPEALTRVYFPAPDIGVGVDQNEYVICVRALLAEMDAAGGGIGGGGTIMADPLDDTVRDYTGVPYVLAGIPEAWQNPWSTGWDCSGMVHWLDQKYGDGRLEKGSHPQYAQMEREGRLFWDTSQLQRGDLIFFDTGNYSGWMGHLNKAGHVGVYLGDDRFFHAANTEVDTIVSQFTAYLANNQWITFIGAAHTPLSRDHAPGITILNGDRQWDGSCDLIMPNGSIYYGHPAEVEVVVNDLKRRNFALRSAPETGPALNTGDTFRTLGWVVGKDDDLDPKEWWISAAFDRIWTGGTMQRPPEVDPTTRPLSPLDRIVRRRVFHAADPKNGKPITVTVARDGGKVYLNAAVNSPLGRKKPLKKGEKLVVVEFVHSDELNGESWWWRTKNNKRVNVSETVEKPYVVQ